MGLQNFPYPKYSFFTEIKSYFFKKLLLFFEKGSIIFPCCDESSIGYPVHREAAVGASRSREPRESAFGARGESRGIVPLTVRQKRSPFGWQFGWQHGVFSSHKKRGEKAFYFVKNTLL